jgi:hypothetical protein
VCANRSFEVEGIFVHGAVSLPGRTCRPGCGCDGQPGSAGPRAVAVKRRGPFANTGKGLIDTGSDITAVALPILQQLGAPAVRQAATQSVGGSVPVNLYRVSLHILDVQHLGLPWLSQASLVVMELAAGFPFDGLIGLDVLLTCKLHLDGPARQFTMEF